MTSHDREDGFRDISSHEELLGPKTELLDQHDELLAAASRRRARRWPQWLWTLCSGIALVLSMILGFAAGVQWHPHDDSSSSTNAKACLDLTSQQSPLTPDVSISWEPIRFNGSLLKENIYRQRGSPEVDAAWEALGVNYRSVVVPADQAERVGLRTDQVQISEKYGGGYPANVEGLHQLHCLNLVRQSLYYNIDYYRERGSGAFHNNAYILERHVSHCLDILRQQLMCSVDVGVMGQVWCDPASSTTGPEAYVDVNTMHVCRNFEDVRAWAEMHQMPEQVPEDFLRPPKEGDRVYKTIP